MATSNWFSGITKILAEFSVMLTTKSLKWITFLFIANLWFKMPMESLPHIYDLLFRDMTPSSNNMIWYFERKRSHWTSIIPDATNCWYLFFPFHFRLPTLQPDDFPRSSLTLPVTYLSISNGGFGNCFALMLNVDSDLLKLIYLEW